MPFTKLCLETTKYELYKHLLFTTRNYNGVHIAPKTSDVKYPHLKATECVLRELIAQVYKCNGRSVKKIDSKCIKVLVVF